MLKTCRDRKYMSWHTLVIFPDDSAVFKTFCFLKILILSQSRPCFNFQRFEDGESVCECPDGFAGRFCESEIDNCLDEPCGEFGECMSDITGFRCTCDSGFEGAMTFYVSAPNLTKAN